MQIRAVLFLCVLSISFHWSKGQEVSNEFNTWTSIKIQKKLNKKFTAFLSPELRTTDTSITKYLLEAGMVFKLNKNFSSGLVYRYTSEQGKSGWQNFGRFAVDIRAKKKIKRFTPQLRVRYTHEVDTSEDVGTRYFRYKTGAKYNIRKSKLTPFIFAEAFQKLEGNSLAKWRYSTGMEYKFNKRNSLSLGYRLDAFTQKDAKRHIINTAYRFKF